MHAGRALLLCLLALAAGACGKPPVSAGSGASASAQPGASPAAAAVSAAAASDAAAVAAAGDPARGKTLFLQCRACHSLAAESEPGKIGPTLYGVIGRVAGSVPGFAYSDAVAKSGITWTPEQLDRWLTRPSDFLPDNRMVFVGIQNPQDRADIIAFIRQESGAAAQ